MCFLHGFCLVLRRFDFDASACRLQASSDDDGIPTTALPHDGIATSRVRGPGHCGLIRATGRHMMRARGPASISGTLATISMRESAIPARMNWPRRSPPRHPTIPQPTADAGPIAMSCK
jgi:hypothetical protein